MRDRIRGFARLPRERLAASERNWREHDEKQRSVLRAYLDSIGVAGAAVAWVADDEARDQLRENPFEPWLAGYGGTFTLIDGHMRREEIAVVPTLVTDLDKPEADELLLTFDPIGQLAKRNETLLGELIASTPRREGGVALLDELMKFTGRRERRKGRREEERSVVGFVVLVECDSEDHQLEVIGRLMGEGLRCRALT